jgi:hypothetical protein
MKHLTNLKPKLTGERKLLICCPRGIPRAISNHVHYSEMDDPTLKFKMIIRVPD